MLSLGNPIGSPWDKVRVGIYRLKTLLRSYDQVLSAPEVSTMQRLKVCSCQGVLDWPQICSLCLAVAGQPHRQPLGQGWGIYRPETLLRSYDHVLSAPEVSTMQRLKVSCYQGMFVLPSSLQSVSCCW